VGVAVTLILKEGILFFFRMQFWSSRFLRINPTYLTYKGKNDIPGNSTEQEKVVATMCLGKQVYKSVFQQHVLLLGLKHETNRNFRLCYMRICCTFALVSATIHRQH
jgi:hypothetical protein